MSEFRHSKVYDWCSKNLPDLNRRQILSFIAARGRSMLSEEEIIQEIKRVLQYNGKSVLQWCKEHNISYVSFRRKQENNDAEVAINYWLAGKKLLRSNKASSTRCNWNCKKRNCEGCPFYLYNGMTAIVSVSMWHIIIAKLSLQYPISFIDEKIHTTNYIISRYGAVYTSIQNMQNNIIEKTLTDIDSVLELIEEEYREA